MLLEIRCFVALPKEFLYEGGDEGILIEKAQINQIIQGGVK